MKLLTLLLIFLALFTSCTPTKHSVETEVVAGNIIGGTPVAPHLFPTTVALTLENHTPSARSQFCSGTIINKNTVMTAAHCLALLTHEDNAKLAVHVGEGQDTNYFGEYSVEQVRVHPDFLEIDNADFINDIAYVTIKDQFKNISTYPELMNQQEIEQLINNKPVTIVGFGTREDDNRGTKYQTDTYLIKQDQNYITTKSDMHDACHGDSGGSLYFHNDQKLYYLGITSHSAADPGSPDAKCGMSTNYVLATHAMSWYKEDQLAQEIEKLNDQQKWQEAIAKSQELSNYSSSSLFLATAHSYIGLKNFKQALTILNNALIKHPHSLATQVEKINLLHQHLNDYQQAKKLVLHLLMLDSSNKQILQYTKDYSYPKDEVAYALGQGSLYANHLGFDIRTVRVASEYFKEAYQLNPSNQNYLWYLNTLALEGSHPTTELIKLIEEAPFDYHFIAQQTDPAGADSRYYAFKSRNDQYLAAFLLKFPNYNQIIQKNINEYLTDAVSSYGGKIFEYLLTHYERQKIHYTELLQTIIKSPTQEILNVLVRQKITFSQFFTEDFLREKVKSLFSNNYLNISVFLIKNEPLLQKFSMTEKEIESNFSNAVDYGEYEAVNYFLKEYNGQLNPNEKQLIKIIENAILSYSENNELIQTILLSSPFNSWDAPGEFDSDMTLLEMVLEEENSELTSFILAHSQLSTEQKNTLMSQQF